MIYTITFIILALVAINFILLAFSCNKIKRAKSKKINRPYIVKSKPYMVATKQPVPNHLSPTGS